MRFVKDLRLLTGTGLILTLALTACGTAGPTSNTAAASTSTAAAPPASAVRSENPAALAFQTSTKDQWVPVIISDRSISIPSGSFHPGVIRLHIINAGQKPHELTVTGNGSDSDSGPVAAGKVMTLQGLLDMGHYQLAVDAASEPPGPSITLTIQ